MGGVIVDEILGQPVDVVDAHHAAFQLEPALDQLAGAGADHVARRLQRHRRQAFTVEHEIERGDQVGRGIDERAVEIEDNSAGKGHGNSLAAGTSIMQVGKFKSREEPPCENSPARQPL